MADLSFSDPVWSSSAVAPVAYPSALSLRQADVVVIGAGFFGLSTALQVARLGLSVQVIEAQAIGAGASGLNGGQVIPGLKYDPDYLLQHFGPEAGERLIQFAAGTADAVFDLIKAENLDVLFTRTGWIQAAHTETALAAARERDRQWRARGADAQLLDASGIQQLTGARGYIGGWLDRRAGVINPLAFIRELARIAAVAGAAIATHTSVKSIRKVGKDWVTTTAQGIEIKSKYLVVATNAYSGNLVPGLAQTLVPLHSFQIATAPLNVEQLARILPEGQAVSDSRRILVYYRKSPDGRLVLGGRGRMGLPTGRDNWAHLHRAMLRLYPFLDGIAIEKRWYGRVGVTTDHLPHLHQPEPGLLVAVGCQGRGVGLMTALGGAFARYIQSGDATALPLPLSPIRPIPFHRFRQIGVAATITWYRFLDALER